MNDPVGVGAGVTTDPGDEAPPRSAADRRKAAVVLGLLLLLATVLQVAHVARYTKVSPYDELQHLDYLVRAPRGDIPGAGDLVLEESGRIETCARVDAPFDINLQRCAGEGESVDVPKLQEGGYNTAYIHPPTYYMVDGVLARVIDAVIPGDQSLLTTGRLAGVVWFWAAVVMLWLLLAEVGAGLLVRSAVVVIIITAPPVIHAAATINTDGTSLALGAAVVWAAVRWEKGRLPLWVLGVLGVLASATKVTNLAAVGVAVIYLAWPAFRAIISARTGARTPPDRADQHRRMWAAGTMLVSALAAAVVWTIAMRFLQLIPPSEVPMVVAARATSFPVLETISNWRQTVSPLLGPYIPSFLRSTAMLAVAGIADLAVLVAAVAGAILSPPHSSARRLAVTTLSVMVLLGPALVLFNYVVQGLYSSITPRYGLPLLPALAAASVPALRRPLGKVGSVGLAGASLAVLAWGLAFPLGA